MRPSINWRSVHNADFRRATAAARSSIWMTHGENLNWSWNWRTRFGEAPNSGEVAIVMANFRHRIRPNGSNPTT